MSDHKFKEGRIQQVNKRMHFMMRALETGDLEKFGEILENEALTLHSLMMSSEPAYLLIEPNTVKILQRIESFRKEKKASGILQSGCGPKCSYAVSK